MRAITGHLRRFKRGKRGISTVIVVMLSLVLVVIIVSNVVLWSFQMNQVDWEKMQEKIDVVGVEAIVQNWNQTPSDYSLLGSTNLTGGSVANLTVDDGSYMTFRSYNSGTHVIDFVDSNSSNVDSSPNKGTQSNFTAQQSGPNSIYDKLTEATAGGLTNSTLVNGESFEGTWPPTGWSATGFWTRTSSQRYSGTYSAYFPGDSGRSGYLTTPDLSCADAAALYIDFWYRDGGCEAAEFMLQYFNGASWQTISDLGATSNENQWLRYQEKITDSQYFKSTFKIRFFVTTNHVSDIAYVDVVTIRKEVDNTNYELDLEVQWTSADYSKPNKELAIYANKATNTHSLYGTGGYIIIGGNPDWGSAVGTISFWIKWDSVGGRPWGQHDDMETRFSGSNLVLDWGTTSALTSSTSFVSGKWYFIAIVWNENNDQLFLYVGDQTNPPIQDAVNNGWTSSVSTLGVTQNNFLASKGGVDPVSGRGDELRYWTIDRSLAEIQSSYNAQLTGTETNLRSYFKLDNDFIDSGPAGNNATASGSTSFQTDTPFTASSETLRVDVWFGGSWQNVFTDLVNGWNNVSVSSYLNSSTFTIRFKGGLETGDLFQDRWNIDAVLLRTWTDEHTAEVEFTSVSNVENWTQLDWLLNSAWTISEVNVTIQLYNFTSGAYQTSGFGYLAYTSSATPNTDEDRNQTTSGRTNDFRNATGSWKIKIKGVKPGASQFDLKVDFLEFREVKGGGTQFTFENSGSFTSRIVAIWVSNSTIHQRYATDLFLNSGETLSRAYANINLPDGNFTVKIASERGNTAVLPVS